MQENADQPIVEFAWSAHPARQRCSRAVLGAAVILLTAAAISLMVWGTGGSTLAAAAWGALSLAVLVLTLNRFFFRSRFAIDADGITARFPLRTLRYRWDEVRRFAHDDFGGHLSRRARRSPLDAYSGLPVLFGDAGQTVVERIRAHLREARGS